MVQLLGTYCERTMCQLSWLLEESRTEPLPSRRVDSTRQQVPQTCLVRRSEFREAKMAVARQD